MVRAPSIDTNGMKKGAWSQEEDMKLRAYVLRYGHWNWRQLPKYAGLARCGKSCRLRWINYLQPNVKRGNYTKEEEDLILKLHNDLGNKWSAIAAKLPGRSDNEIKNYWHTKLKKRLKLPITEHGGTTESDGQKNDQKKSDTLLLDVNEEKKSTIDVNSLVTTVGSYEPCSSESSQGSLYEFNEDIWVDPFFADLTNEFLCPLGNDFFSPPSPVMVQDFLWSYDLFSGEQLH